MDSQKKNLFVTFADDSYFAAAQQLFAAAHTHGSWNGEYMLITPREHEGLAWFRDRGIAVRVCSSPAVFGDLVGFPVTLYSIFYLFTQEFKRYHYVVYFDVDCLIRYSISDMLIPGAFAVAHDILYQRLAAQFVKKQVLTHHYSPSSHVGISDVEYDRRYALLQKKYNLKKRMFNAGVFSFDTGLIKADTFDELCELAKTFGPISAFPPQGELNLYFYNNWHVLSSLYNVYPEYWHTFYGMRYERIDGAVLHFAASKKPWNTSSFFYQEWKEMADHASEVDFLTPVKKNQPLSLERAAQLERFLLRRRRYWSWVVYFDKMMGVIGLFIKRHAPWLYKALGRTGTAPHDSTTPNSTHHHSR